MPATITDTFRRKLLDHIFNEVTFEGVVTGDSDYYYIGIGRSEEWPGTGDATTTPTASNKDEREFRSSMQSVKRVDDSSFVSTRYNWSSGTIYSAYDDKGYTIENALYSYYVITDISEVYVCLKQGKTTLGVAKTSTVQPTNTTGNAFETGDGYVWKHLFALDTAKINKFLASGFIPTAVIPAGPSDSDLSDEDVARRNIQNAAVPGQIIGIAIDSAGTGYNVAPPALTIVGDGDSAQAYCIIDSSSGTIVDVFMKPSAGGAFTFGQNYTYASVTVATGDAFLRPIIGPAAGMGADPRTDLRSNGVMFNVKPDGTENDTFFINEFRQVGLLRNPLRDSDASAMTALTGTASRYLGLASASITDGESQYITGDTSAAYAKVDWHDTTNARLYYHQDETTGFTKFAEGETLSFTDTVSTATLDAEGTDADSDAWSYATIDKYSGDLLYIDNRAYVTRDAAQIEDIKIVIQI